MAGDDEKPYKEGYLFFPPHGVIGQLKKAWHKRYCQLFKASKQGIERLEIYENEDEASKALSLSIITLENCVKITQDPQKNQQYVFIMVTKTGVHHFAGNSEDDMSEWIIAFQSVAFKDTASRQTIEEDNDLYCSSGDGVFSVKLVSSEASERCGLESGDYTLLVGPAELQLKRNNTVLQTWPYRFIRRYGYRAGKFTFEAGRKCASGEGSFVLEHANQQEIFKCLSAKMKTMKTLLSGDSIVCGEGQFQHALGMTARTRSPLPPSPTSTCPLPPPLRPRKPPRKHPPPPPAETRKAKDIESHAEREFQSGNEEMRGKIFVQPTTINNYDRLQHFGSLKPRVGYETPAPPLPERESALNRPQEPVLPSRLPDRETSSNRLLDRESVVNRLCDREPSSNRLGEREPSTNRLPEREVITSRSQEREFISSKDLKVSLWSLDRDIMNSRLVEREIFPDIDVKSSDLEILPARSADDSHQGYGVIRKKSQPHHTVYNGLEYAVVCKPHMV